MLYYIKQIDSMLPWVCSVIDHRRRQNVERTSVTHSAIASCATFLFLPHFDVICDLSGTLRKDNENADVNPRGLGRDVAVAVDVAGHFFLTVRNAKNSGNSVIRSPLQVLEP